MRRWLTFAGVALLALTLSAAHAQDSTQIDPYALARDLLGVSEPSIPLPSPLYQQGDVLPFWVSKAGADEPTQIQAELAGASAYVYLWVEQGLQYDSTAMQQFAQALSPFVAAYRIPANYAAQVSLIPQSSDDVLNNADFIAPDVDNDPQLYILFGANLQGPTSLYNPANSITAESVPGGFSSQHETIMLNTSAVPGAPLSDPSYFSVISRQLYEMTMTSYNPTQTAWLRYALGWYMLLSLQSTTPQASDFTSFAAAPGTRLTQLPVIGSQGQEFGIQQLFLAYLRQRLGDDIFAELFFTPGDGLDALDTILTRHSITDLVSGQALTAADLYADFVMANAINAPLGDGRYQHSAAFAQDFLAQVYDGSDLLRGQAIETLLSPLANDTFAIKAGEDITFNLAFSGEDSNRRLPMASDTANHFYWTGNTAGRNVTLTRLFDLSRAFKPVLSFDTWYNLAANWNYAYVEVSTDGDHWQTLPAQLSNTSNPFGLNYGAGFTGVSNPEPPRPFPYMAIGLGNDGVTITQVVPDGPADQAGIQVNDIIAGHDGAVWSGTPNLIGYLGQYKPGDTVNLLMQRDGKSFDAAVTLTDHPTRRFIPSPLWQHQEVDLSAYSGQAVLVRFQAILQAGSDDLGWAVDNIQIPQIGFVDDAESAVPDWQVNGWHITDNRIPQTFAVQAAILNETQAENNRVVPLLRPADAAANGQWTLTLKKGETLLLSVTNLNDETNQAAAYRLTAEMQS